MRRKDKEISDPAGIMRLLKKPRCAGLVWSTGTNLMLCPSVSACRTLNIIMAHYSEQQFAFPESKLKATTVIKVEIESVK